MKYVNFSKEEKAECFDKICNCFFNTNFGQTSKSEIEAMMFHFYIEKLIKENSDSDGLVDYNACSDYKISKDLGITQQRVRNLKIKNQLLYPKDIKWEKAFAKLTKNARFDQKTNKLIINIPDPNLFIEIQNYLEEQGGFVEKQLNGKILQIRIEYFIALLLSFEEDKTQKDIIRELKKQLKKENEIDKSFDDKNIAQSLIEASADIISIISNICLVANPESIIAKSLLNVLNLV